MADEHDESRADGASPSDAQHPEMVDWDLAVTTARRLIKPGPEVTRAEAQHVVRDLRGFAQLAEEHVRSHTGLHAESASAPVLVVDRVGWVQANADGFREVLRPLIGKLHERRGGEIGGLTAAIGSRVTGLEAGGLLAFLSNKVLGQFDPFYTGPDGAPPTYGGRLLLVAPNVVHVERELDVDPRDFRLWVCLHEETHRVQFTAVPWLREHVLGLISGLLESTELDPQRLASLMRDGIERIGRLVKGDEGVSIVDILQSPQSPHGCG
jgi:coenzyme F420 biosynthesis associated uncharacterized protein